MKQTKFIMCKREILFRADDWFWKLYCIETDELFCTHENITYLFMIILNCLLRFIAY